MFDEPKTSLGDLEEDERTWAFMFLKGESWDEQFECLEADEGTIPPEWLINWSASWDAEFVMTIDDVDPLIGEYLLVIDKSNNEAWAAIHQGDDQVAFTRVPVDGANPDKTTVCDFFLGELEEVGSCTFVGNLTINASRWLPRERVEVFLRDRMNQLNEEKMGNLTLEQWLKREYEAGKNRRRRRAKSSDF